MSVKSRAINRLATSGVRTCHYNTIVRKRGTGSVLGDLVR